MCDDVMNEISEKKIGPMIEIFLMVTLNLGVNYATCAAPSSAIPSAELYSQFHSTFCSCLSFISFLFLSFFLLFQLQFLFILAHNLECTYMLQCLLPLDTMYQEQWKLVTTSTATFLMEHLT
jgi:hypothetical protein